MSRHYLFKLFEPSSIALFGASERENAVGTLVFKNLLESDFAGPVYPINLKRKQIQGQPAFPSLKAIGQQVDLAVIVTPASTVPDIIEACGRYGIKDVLILSAGFREVGEAGLRIERAVTQAAKRHGIRFVGPNCLGIMRPSIGLNATFNRGMAKPGNIALVSQSGAMCTAILDWAEPNGIGFSAVISTGISADLDFGEILDYLVSDPQTSSILLYIEGIQHGRKFMSALRAAARVKPVIALKVGRHASGTKAAQSHTGALVGSDDVFGAVLRRAGVVRGKRIISLFSAATTLSSRYRTQGDRLLIVTNGGGPAAMASDRASDLTISLAELGTDTIKQLDQVLPPTWSKGNPVDVIGDATPERYQKTVDLVLRDPGVDGVLVILTPQAMTEPEKVAESMVEIAKHHHRKPLLTCWMGETQVRGARELLRKAGIPTFNTPEAAVEGFSYLTRYYRNQRLLLQTPAPITRHRKESDVEGARMIIEGALMEGRKVLSETESKAVLAAFHIPTAQSSVVRSPNEALIQAETLGFPVALKINSRDITHKSDAGGVRLGINSAQGVRSAYTDIIQMVSKSRPEARLDGITIEPMVQRPNGRELLVGIITDPVFGPVITFGAGGTLVEVMEDRAIGLPPLNRVLVNDLIEQTRIAKMLKQFRHMAPVNMEALENVLLRTSEMACELPWIKELDINPLIADENGAIAADARIVVDYHAPSTESYSHMVIHPYPSHMVTRSQLSDGTELIIRPIRPEDADIERAFIKALSERSKYFRFMMVMDELPPEMLARFTQIDYDREMALIAVVEQDGEEKEIGVSRYVTNPDGESCEFAIVVSDDWHHRGIAHRLMQALINTARQRGLRMMEGDILANNSEMLGLVRNLGFDIQASEEDPSVHRAYLYLDNKQ